MKVKELIEKINSADECYSIFDAEEMIEGQYERIKKNLDIDRHRWYEISTSVFKLDDGFVGIRGVSHLYSESMVFSDTNVHSTAEEYEEVTVVSYRPKNNN